MRDMVLWMVSVHQTMILRKIFIVFRNDVLSIQSEFSN